VLIELKKQRKEMAVHPKREELEKSKGRKSKDSRSALEGGRGRGWSARWQERKFRRGRLREKGGTIFHPLITGWLSKKIGRVSSVCAAIWTKGKLHPRFLKDRGANLAQDERVHIGEPSEQRSIPKVGS